MLSKKIISCDQENLFRQSFQNASGLLQKEIADALCGEPVLANLYIPLKLKDKWEMDRDWKVSYLDTKKAMMTDVLHGFCFHYPQFKDLLLNNLTEFIKKMNRTPMTRENFSQIVFNGIRETNSDFKDTKGILSTSRATFSSTGEAMLYFATKDRGRFLWDKPDYSHFMSFLSGTHTVSDLSIFNCWEAQLYNLIQAEYLSTEEIKKVYDYCNDQSLCYGSVLSQALTFTMNSSPGKEGFESLPIVSDNNYSAMEKGKSYFLMMDRVQDRSGLKPEGMAHFGVYYPFSRQEVVKKMSVRHSCSPVTNPEDGTVSNHWIGWTGSFDFTTLKTFVTAKCESVRILEVNTGIANLKKYISEIGQLYFKTDITPIKHPLCRIS